MRRVVAWLALILIWGGRTVLASEYLVDIWQTEDGLPQNSVTAIAQTPDGYLWLGTFAGLARFDGVRFSVFDSENTPELRSSRIVRLYLDRHGQLWIVSEGGDLARMVQGRFAAFTRREGLPERGADALSEDVNGRLWLSDLDGRMFAFDGSKFLPAREPPGIAPGNFDAFLADNEGNQWIVQNNRTIASRSAGQYEILKEADGQTDAYVRAALRSRGGGLWLTNGRSVRKLRQQGWEGPAVDFSAERTSVFGMCEDRLGNVWLGTFAHGLFRCTPDGRVDRLTTSEGLSHYAIRCVYEDFEGNLWIGTDGGGLNRLRRRLFSTRDMRDGLGGNIVMSVCEDRAGRIWIASNGGGLNRLVEGGGTRLLGSPALSTNHYVWSVLADRQGAIWFGTWGTGLFRLTDRGDVTRYAEADGLGSDFPLVLFEDRRGTMWIGGPGGLSRMENGCFTTFGPKDGLCDKNVRALAEDRQGRLFIGTDRGLDCFENGRFIHYTRRNGLANEQIRGLFVDADDTLWIGTGAGFSRFKGGQFFNFSGSSGLPTKLIGSIIEDDLGHLWMVGSQSIVRANRAALNAFAEGQSPPLIWQNYDKLDGLGSGESSSSGRVQPAVWKARDGRLWFGTVKGAAVVDPRNVEVNRRPPPVFIEQIVVDEQTINLGPNIHSDPAHRGPTSGAARAPRAAVFTGKPAALRIPPGTRRFDIHYTGLSFAAPERVRFRYRLKGLDPHWVEAGIRRVAYYTRLKPGRYRFEVTACNHDGVWNESGASLAVVALPYFWQTGWFMTLTIGSLAAITGWTVRVVSLRRWRQKLRALEQQQALERERARIAQDIHDDLGARLTQIGLLSELARLESSRPAQVQSHVARIAENTREVVRALDEIVWAVDPTKDTLDNLANYFAAFAGEFFEGTSIRCRLDLPPELPAAPLSAELRHSLFLVVKEALNNIVKHAVASEAWLRLTRDGSVLTLTIEDNGRGFDPGQPETDQGNGLTNMRKRIEELDGAFELSSQPGRGTKIELRIKF